VPEPPLPDLPEWPSREKLAGEKEMIGFYVTGHPLDEYMDKVAELATHDTSNLENLEKGHEVALCGILTSIQRRRNKEGKLWASMQIEDLQGSVDAMVFASSYEQLAQQLVEDKAVLVKGVVMPEENAPPKISIKDVIPLDVARVPYPTLVSIRVRLGQNGNGDKAEALKQLFVRKPGQTEVRLRLEKPRDFALLLDITAKIRPDKEFKAALNSICGPESLEVLAT